MRFSKRSGIGAALVVLALVIVVAAAGVGVYVLTSGPSSSSSSTTSTTSSSATQTQTLPTTSATSSEMTTSQESTSSVPTTSTTHLTTSTTSSTTQPPTSSITESTSFTTCSGTETTATTSTTTTSTTTANPLAFDIGFINQFKAISTRFNGTSGNTTSAEIFSYAVIASSGSLKEVNFTITSSESSQSQTVSSISWVDTSAMSVINFTESYNVGGKVYSQTFTGAEAQTLFTGEMEIFYIYQSTYGSQYYSLFTSSQFFHSAGTSTESFGPTSFQVTTYVANNTPEVINTCSNVFTLNSYELQVGTPHGTSTTFITKIEFSGSEIVNGQLTNEDYNYQLVSLTLA